MTKKLDIQGVEQVPLTLTLTLTLQEKSKEGTEQGLAGHLSALHHHSTAMEEARRERWVRGRCFM